MKPKYQVLTTTIKADFLRQIIDGEKVVEYRDIKPYWDKKLAKFETPFLMRLINGMRIEAPEITVEVYRVRKYESTGKYHLYFRKTKQPKNTHNLKNG